MSINNKHQILLDHKKIGKKFVPPFIDKLGSTFQETSWIKLSIPELVWIALLNNRYGYQQGADLALSLARATKEATGKIEWYATLSSFSSLTRMQSSKIIEILKQEGKLDKLVTGLASLNYYYPKCSLRFLKKKIILKKEDKEAYLSEIKNVLLNLFDKTSQEATFIQANAIYICFVLGKLQVTSKSSLANFPEIENYPHTEESKKIASAIRALINGFIGDTKNKTSWPQDFWNRGLEIDGCE